MFIVVVAVAGGRLRRRRRVRRGAVLRIELQEVWFGAEVWDEGLEVVGGEHGDGCVDRAEDLHGEIGRMR